MHRSDGLTLSSLRSALESVASSPGTDGSRSPYKRSREIDDDYSESFTPTEASTFSTPPCTTKMESKPFKMDADAAPLPPAPPSPLHVPPSLSTLDPDQMRAYTLALSGANLFMTGGAGVGKSTTLNVIIEALKVKHGERNVAVTASTGTASVHVDGQTLHSLAGMGVPVHISDFGRLWASGRGPLCEHPEHGGHKAERWKQLKVLILDEVSMIDAEWLDHLSMTVDRIVNYTEIRHAQGWRLVKAADGSMREERVGPRVERAAKPFGGRIQLIFSGDFLQLPPVKKQPPPRTLSHPHGARAHASAGSHRPGEVLPTLKEAPPPAGQRGGARAPLYHTYETHGALAFQSVVWREAALVPVELTVVHRQREPLLKQGLNEVRAGRGAAPAVRALCAQTRRELGTSPTSGEEPIRLFCTNDRADGVNQARLAELLRTAAPRQQYTSLDSVEVDEQTVEEEVAAGRVREEVVAELEAELWYHHFREHDRGRPDSWRESQYDETCTYAVGAQVMLTKNESPWVSKQSEGAQGDGEPCVRQRFVNGDIGTVVAFRPPTADEAEALRGSSGQWVSDGEAGRLYPIVRFHRRNSAGERERLILPSVKTRRLHRVGTCTRRKLPLQLAWAITCHKSQGMTLPWVQVELANAFAPGQCYVALSRAKSVGGLCIKSFDATRVGVSYEAQRFHAAVSRASRERSPTPLDEYWAHKHFWWRHVVEGSHAHPEWLDIYRNYGRYSKDSDSTELHGGTSFGSEFARWVQTYPVPDKYKCK